MVPFYQKLTTVLIGNSLLVRRKERGKEVREGGKRRGRKGKGREGEGRGGKMIGGKGGGGKEGKKSRKPLKRCPYPIKGTF